MNTGNIDVCVCICVYICFDKEYVVLLMYFMGVNEPLALSYDVQTAEKQNQLFLGDKCIIYNL